MSDELKLKRQRDLGIRAKQLRDDPMLKGILEGLRAKYMKEWASTEIGDAQGREQKYMLLHALLDMWAELNAICSNGDAAVKFLAEYEKRQQAA